MNSFPSGFIFGASTSAFQIEGALDTDGRGPSIWDEFAKRPGAVRGGYPAAARACEHYRLWKEDVALVKRLGLGAYRFSISWPRVLPSGRGKPNPKGLDFYSRLVDELLENGIAPFPTLFHWDLPLALQSEIGGFASRDIVPIFADYAALVARRLGDRVQNWITVNEPFEFACFGHLLGSHAPEGRVPARSSTRCTMCSSHTARRSGSSGRKCRKRRWGLLLAGRRSIRKPTPPPTRQPRAGPRPS